MKKRRMPRSRARALSRTHLFRCRVLCCLAAGGGILMMGRAFQLQVAQGAQWQDLARSQTIERTPLPAARGGLYDRNLRPLTVSQAHYRAFYAPAEVRDRRSAIESFRQILNLSSRDERRLDGGESGWISLGVVDGRTRSRLQDAVEHGVHFETVAARSYPEGRLASGLLGAVGSDGHGLSGLELVFDSLLAGTPGEQVSRRDGRGVLYPTRHGESVPARPGVDLVLTIDVNLQEIAEAALARAMSETGASGGDVILGDPHTGEILALASSSAESDYKIPAFTDPYEPGSTAKAVLLATLLQEDLALLDEPIDVEGGTFRTPYRTISDVHAFDTLSVAEVVLHSSNIGAAKLADRIEPGMQYSYLRDFGFGTPTGIEAASEAAGVLRRPDEWSRLSQHSLAYGYELTVTSIQLLSAYGALANGGVLRRPTLVREVRSPDGSRDDSGGGRRLRRVIDKDVAEEITKVLTEVVREGGTGDEAALRTLDIAGKTGTSRVSAGGGYGTGRYVASFVGYVPAEDPQLVILAKLDDPKTTIYGGAAAAPVSRAVMQAILAAEESGFLAGSIARHSTATVDWSGPGPDVAVTPYRLVSANEPTGPSAELPAEPELVVPDVRGLGLRAAVAQLHSAGLEVELVSETPDRIRRTSPTPGSVVVPGATVLLR